MNSEKGHYTPSAQEAQLIQEKDQLANELQLVFKGRVSVATYERDLRNFYQQHGFKHGAGGAANFVQPLCIGETCTPPPAKDLTVTQIPQQNTEYCGPATAEMVVNFLGHDTPQSTLAESPWLNTDNDHGTNYSSNVMAPTLNTFGQTNGYYVQTNVSSLSTYESNMTYDITNLWPVVIAAYELSPNTLYPTENTWKHWFVVRGYSSSGAISDFADPAGNTTW